ncbi:MAG: DUF5908 family protein [Bacteroidota bacterium]|nr:DUF5908 family protein [Bacteroidota bacterium]
MPIEIKELHIKAIVATGKDPQQNASLKPEDISKLKKEITKEVTKKVLKILQQKNER